MRRSGVVHRNNHRQGQVDRSVVQPVTMSQRLAECLRRVSDAEEALVSAREFLSDLCTETDNTSFDRQCTSTNGTNSDAQLEVKLDVRTEENAVSASCPPYAESGIRNAFNQVVTGPSPYAAIDDLDMLLESVYGRRPTAQERDNCMSELSTNKEDFINCDEFVRAFMSAQKMHMAPGPIAPEFAVVTQESMPDAGDTAELVEKLPTDVFTVVNTTGVSKSSVTQFLRKEMREAAACLQLPSALMLFVGFWFSVTLHLGTEQLHALDRAVIWDITENANFAFSGIVPFDNGRMGHKSVYDVNSFADFWSWMDMGMVPLFWPEGWDRSEVRTNVLARCNTPIDALNSYALNMSLVNTTGSPPLLMTPCPEAEDVPKAPANFYGTPRTPTYLFYNTIVAGGRMRQERVNAESCTLGDKNVHGVLHADRCVRDLGYWLEPELHQGLLMNEDYVKDEDTVYLLSGSSQKSIREQLRKLEDSVWLRPETAKVEILFITYNQHVDVLTCTFILFFVNRGGHIHKIIEPVSLWLTPYPSWQSYLADAFWVLLVLRLAIQEGKDLAHHWRQLGFAKGTYVYADFVNFVDWVSVMVSVFIYGFWVYHTQTLLSITDYLAQANYRVIGSWTDPAIRKDFFRVADWAVKQSIVLRTMTAFYPFAIALRFFKAFNAQPRLSMVTKTLMRASTDIFHFGVVFGTVFMIFALSSNILFGQELVHFANFTRSVNTCFRTLLGDFDWEAMERVGKPQAGVWFWLFMWLVNLIMLNMLLAIIMDVYSVVKEGVGPDAETLFSQGREIVIRWIGVRTGKLLPLKKILRALDPTDLDDDDEAQETQENPKLTVTTFMETVPNLKKEQALSILADSQRFEDANAKLNPGDDPMATKLTEIGVMLSNIHRSVNTFTQLSSAITTNGDGTRESDSPPAHLFKQLKDLFLTQTKSLKAQYSESHRMMDVQGTHLDSIMQNLETLHSRLDNSKTVPTAPSLTPTKSDPGPNAVRYQGAPPPVLAFGNFCTLTQKSPDK